MSRCQARKAALVRESEINRCLLRLECVPLRRMAENLDFGVRVAKNASAAWRLGAFLLRLRSP